MSVGSAIAIFFIIWWLCLFVILPFGVRNAEESGDAVSEGHEPGAPVNPMLWRKAIATTVLAGAVFGVFYAAKVRGWLSLDAFPFLR